MSTEEIIIRLFCSVDDIIGPVKKRSDAHLHDSEIVTIGLVFAQKGGRYRAFYRWLNANYRALFPKLPDVTRLSSMADLYRFGGRPFGLWYSGFDTSGRIVKG